MNSPIVVTNRPLALLGAGKACFANISIALENADKVVAADGGAEISLKNGRIPDAVIGDFDSLDEKVRNRIPPARLHRIDEQDSTDFEKCLARIQAPLILAAGFAGGRLDHELACLNALARFPDQRCILLGEEDLCFLAPPMLDLALSAGTRLSLFPLGPVRGASTGLRWPIDGIGFTPGGRIGTSNVVSAPNVTLRFDQQSMLVLLPISCLAQAVQALAPQLGPLAFTHPKG